MCGQTFVPRNLGFASEWLVIYSFAMSLPNMSGKALNFFTTLLTYHQLFSIRYMHSLRLVGEVRFELTHPKERGLQPRAPLQLCRSPMEPLIARPGRFVLLSPI